MNQIIEKIMSSFLPQGQAWKLVTEKGYWFVATIEGGAYNIETNFDDMSTAERYTKCTFEVNVPAYVWASSAPGVPVPVKRYVSSPTIEFSMTNRGGSSPESPEGFSNNFALGSDDPTLPLDDQANLRNDSAFANTEARGINPSLFKKIQIGNKTKYVKIVTVNAATGETVYSATNFEGLKIIPT